MTKPHSLITALSATSMIAIALAATPVAAQRVEVGNASTVVGKVAISNAQIAEPQQIQRKQRIAWGDVITTGKKSQMQILLLDRSSFGIGARSSVRIDSYVYDPDEGRSLFATFIKGALRFFSGQQDGNNSANIETPAGRIGIRGTALDILVGEKAEDIAEDEKSVKSVKSNDDEATLVILRGPGAATAGGLTPGLVEVEGAGVTVVLDAPGLAAYIPRKGAAPIGPFRISNGALAKVQDRLAPEVARAAGGGSILSKLLPAAVGAVALGLLLSGGEEVDLEPTADDGQDDDVAGRPPTNQID